MAFTTTHRDKMKGHLVPTRALILVATFGTIGATASSSSLLAQTAAAAHPRPQDTEVWTPVPPIVTPGATDAQPPSDAVVLFAARNLVQWVSARDKSPAKWVVANGIVTVNKPSGDIETRRSFGTVSYTHLTLPTIYS